MEPILPLMPILQRQIRDENWELKGQLLILSANILTQFNTMDDTSEENKAGSKTGSRSQKSQDGKLE